jgi:hypothetical protein
VVGVAPVHRRRDILKEKSEGPSAGLSSPQKQQNPHLAGFVDASNWCRGNLKQVGTYLFFLVNNLLVNLLGIPVGTLRGLDSDGR